MRVSSIIILGAFLVLITECTEEAVIIPKNYPFVTTNMPLVASDGVEFSAELTRKGNEKIIGYGYVWSDETNPTIEDSKIIFDGESNLGIYTHHINTGLFKGRTYYVRAIVLTENYKVYGIEKSFISQGSLAPVITSFEPKFGPIGTKVIIEGENFGSLQADNIVKFGNIEVVVDSASENRLVVTTPKITKSDRVQISVKTTGMTTTSQDSFDLWFPWDRISNLPNENKYENVTFSIGGNAYVGLGADRKYGWDNLSNKFWKYDKIKNTWSSISDFPGSPRASAYSFTIGQKGYVMLGIASGYLYDLWEYDPISDKWEQKEDFPGKGRHWATSLSIGNYGYVGLGLHAVDDYHNETLKDFWRYDPIEDKWIQISDFPIDELRLAIGFELNKKGYVGCGSTGSANRALYEYDPLTDHWAYKTSFPGTGRDHISYFVINSRAYLGLGGEIEGFTPKWKFSDIWEFEPIKNSWKRMHD